MGLYHLDAVLQAFGPGAADVTHADLRGAAQGAVDHHQFVAGRIVAGQHAVDEQPPAAARVVAVHGEAVVGAAVAAAHVDDPLVVDGDRHRAVRRGDAALHGGQGSDRPEDIERAGEGRGGRQDKGLGEVKMAAVGEVHRLPVDVAAGSGGRGVLERQRIAVRAAVDARHQAEDQFGLVAQQRGVGAFAHEDGRADVAAAPHEAVIAGAGADFPDHFAALHADAVIAATDADVAAHAPALDDDGVGVEPGHQVALDFPAQQFKAVLVQLHVHTTDGASGHARRIAVLEGASDGAATHAEGVAAVALGQGGDGAAVHDEVIDPVALLHGAGDGAGVDDQRVGAITHVQGAVDSAGVHLHAVGARAEGDVASDAAGAVGGERQAVIARQVGQGTAGAAVANKVVVAGPRRQRARSLGNVGRQHEQGGGGE